MYSEIGVPLTGLAHCWLLNKPFPHWKWKRSTSKNMAKEYTSAEIQFFVLGPGELLVRYPNSSTSDAMRASPSKISSTLCGKEDPRASGRRLQAVLTGIRPCTETLRAGAHTVFDVFNFPIKFKVCSFLSLRRA